MVVEAIDIEASLVVYLNLIEMASFATAIIVSIVSLILVLFVVQVLKDEVFTCGHQGQIGLPLTYHVHQV